VKLQLGQIRPNVARLYARDYIAAWEKIATLPKPAAYFSDAAALGAFTKTPSPLKVLLLELRKNTVFSGGSGRRMVDQAVERSRLGRAVAGAQAVAGDAYDAGTEITNYFKPLHAYVGDGKSPAPVDEFVNAVKQAGSAVTSAKLAGGGMGSEAVQGQMAQAMGGVATAAGGAPPQLQGFLASAATGGETASVSAAQGAISDAYATGVLPDCKLATDEKYPFFGAAKDDASLIDVQRVFGLNGIVDAFIQQRIIPLLDMSGPIWRWNATAPTTAALSPSSPDEFAKARQLRDLLIAGLAVKFESSSFGTGVDGVNLSVGGTQYRFEPATSGQKPVIWAAQGNVPQATLTMFMGQKEVGTVPASGPWALFRLMDNARLENAGPQKLLATFGSGAQTVVFKVSLPNDQNPFIRGGGVWSFRCPVAL
jgi:type VI secretion system protein ImpL